MQLISNPPVAKTVAACKTKNARENRPSMIEKPIVLASVIFDGRLNCDQGLTVSHARQCESSTNIGSRSSRLEFPLIN